MRTRALLLAVLVLTAGCLGADSSEDPSQEDESTVHEDTEGIQEVTRTFVFEADVSAGTEAGEVGVNETKVLGSGLERIELELTWNSSTNAFRAQARSPSGETTSTPSTTAATQASATVEDAGSGLWRFLVEAEGPHTPDRVRLEVTGVWRLPSEAVGGGVLSDQAIETERRSGQWHAWRNAQNQGDVGEEVNVSANATNGRLNLTAGTPSLEPEHSTQEAALASGENALVRVEAWARGDTEQQARERVRSINVSVTIAQGTIEVQAWARTWEQKGLDADIAVPEDTRTTPEMGVTNGEVNAFGNRVQGAELTATNGHVRAGMDVEGDLLLETTNGAIQAALAPQGETNIVAETVNGPIELGLEEASDVGYVIEAETTNGHISESMEEASFDGSNQEGVLRTENADERPLRVTGTTETVNADISFLGG